MSTFRVCISGRALAPACRADIVLGLAGLFCLSPEEAERRLAEAPCAWREGLSEELAAKYCRVMRRLGIECHAEPVAETALPPVRRGWL